MKLAVISDVHGNFWALEAVLEDINKRKIDQIYDLGDSLYGPLEPQKTYELFRNFNIKSLKGNQDQLITDHIYKKSKNPTINYVIDQLDQEALEWLNQLPAYRTLDNSIIMFHGTNANNAEYLVEKLYIDHIGIKSVDELNRSLIKINQKMILCGHSHTSHLIESGRKTIINPGSVGLQSYHDDLPIFHKIENFNTFAKYCIIDFTSRQKVQFLAIPYDYEKAAFKAEVNKRNDWAQWIRTGRI